MKQRFPYFTPDQVADYLKHYAEQREAPDPNNTWGHGFAVLPPPDDTAPPLGFDTSCGRMITADSTVQGQWTADCNSQTPAPEQGGSGGRLARYYTFTLTESADVSVVLESDDAETVLYLREGSGVRSGATVPGGFNDGDLNNYHRAEIVAENLAAGSYTIEATTYNAGETGDFTLTVSVADGTAPPPASGCESTEIEADGSEVDGTWGADCESETPAIGSTGSGATLARYYQFTLTESADVSVVLESDDAETVLYLREGAGVRSGDYLGMLWKGPDGGR